MNTDISFGEIADAYDAAREQSDELPRGCIGLCAVCGDPIKIGQKHERDDQGGFYCSDPGCNEIAGQPSVAEIAECLHYNSLGESHRPDCQKLTGKGR
jgi:hypothetical protein